MNTQALFLIAAVAGVGVLHTIVPDHWVPITLIARQRGWSRRETGQAAFKAGVGHVLSTLAIGIAVWIAGVAFAYKFGHLVDTVASLALIGFGGWIAISALRESKAAVATAIPMVAGTVILTIFPISAAHRGQRRFMGPNCRRLKPAMAP